MQLITQQAFDEYVNPAIIFFIKDYTILEFNFLHFSDQIVSAPPNISNYFSSDIAIWMWDL